MIPESFRCVHACYDCANNKNRLDEDGTDTIRCKLYKIPTAYISTDWVCDFYEKAEIL